LGNSVPEGGTMNGKRDRFGRRFIVSISVILASWLAGVVRFRTKRELGQSGRATSVEVAVSSMARSE
jgi:hypothetical protein